MDKTWKWTKRLLFGATVAIGTITLCTAVFVRGWVGAGIGKEEEDPGAIFI